MKGRERNFFKKESMNEMEEKIKKEKRGNKAKKPSSSSESLREEVTQ